MKEVFKKTAKSCTIDVDKRKEEIMTKEIRCYGCGAVIQSADVNKIGYVPKNTKSEHILCQRCFRMKNYHELQASPLSADDFLKTLQKIADEDCLVVYLLDIFDFNGGQIAGIQRHLGNKDLLLVVNKRDILPKSLKSGRLLMWIRRQLKEIGLKPLDIILSSTKNKIGLDDVFGAIEHYRCQRNVYVVGTTNVGKSSLINHMLQAFKEEQDKPLLITTSEFPGTTLDIIEIPLGDGSYIYDTPGIINESQVTHYVSQKDLKLILPSSEIKQRVYQLNEKQTLFVGGLARFDFVKGDKLAVMCYFSNRLELHRTKLENAKDLFHRHQALKIEATNTDDMDSFKKYNFHLKNQRVDIVIEGLGWFSFQAVNHEISLHVPSGVGVLIRENLI